MKLIDDAVLCRYSNLFLSENENLRILTAANDFKREQIMSPEIMLLLSLTMNLRDASQDIPCSMMVQNFDTVS